MAFIIGMSHLILIFCVPLSSITATSLSLLSHVVRTRLSRADPEVKSSQSISALRPTNQRVVRAHPRVHPEVSSADPSIQSFRSHSWMLGGLVVVGSLLGLELDEELLGLPDALLVEGVDAAGGGLVREIECK